MPTVYTLDRSLQKRVRHRGVVHYALSEGYTGFDRSGVAAIPWAAQCGMEFHEETLEYLADSDPSIVTCIACLGDRRHRYPD